MKYFHSCRAPESLGQPKMAEPHSEALMSKSSFLLFNHKPVKVVTATLCLTPKAEKKSIKFSGNFHWVIAKVVKTDFCKLCCLTFLCIIAERHKEIGENEQLVVVNCCLCSCQLSWCVLRKLDNVFFTVICRISNPHTFLLTSPRLCSRCQVVIIGTSDLTLHPATQPINRSYLKKAHH